MRVLGLVFAGKLRCIRCDERFVIFWECECEGNMCGEKSNFSFNEAMKGSGNVRGGFAVQLDVHGRVDLKME